VGPIDRENVFLEMKLLHSKPNLIALSILMLAWAFSASGQNRGASYAHPFEPREELFYVGEFSRLLLKKVDVADFRFSVSREPQPLSDGSSQTPSNSYALKLTGDISSRGFFSKLFNLHFHERMESMVEPAGFTVRKTNRLDEQGKRRRESETLFDQTNGKLVWVERDPNNAAAGVRSVTTAFTGQVYDILSAIYFLRTQPLEVGKSFAVTISDSGRLYRVPVKVIEKKRLKTVLGRVEVVRLDPDLQGPDGMIKEQGQLSIWLTSDSRRIPVAARLKTEYGTFDITLRKMVGNPARKTT
jgi:hypothetical protein